MRAYELMVIIAADLDDGGTDTALARIDEQVAARGGTIASLDRWGKRRLAYEIDHRHEGFYAVYEIVTEGGGLGDIERQLRLADDVVRHKLIRLPDSEVARRGLGTGRAPATAAQQRGANDG
ncbi:MAG: 30S ribosomal protein S6 [Acidimicrobiales bacterium]